MAHWWDGYPWRLIQTNLREIDMADISAEAYARSMREMHATVAMINVAGIIASYPTELPFHYQSPYLTGDSLEQIIDACHDAGIRVIARTDFSKVRRPLYELHPEWASVYEGGRIEDYNGNVHCCINGDYQRVYAPQIVREAITKLPVDGVFFNMGGFQTGNYSHEYLGICRCENCRRMFGDRFGLELPDAEDRADPVYRRYLEFKGRRTAEEKEAMVRAITDARPDIAIDRNHADGVGFARSESNTEIGRPLPHWQYSAADNTALVATGWPQIVPSNTTVDFLGFPYRHVAVSPAEQELRLWQNLAFCGAVDYYLIGRLDNHRDRSGFAPVERVFAFHEEHFDDVYRGLRPRSDVLLVRGEDRDEYRGWFRLLAENHLLFDAVSLERLTEVDLSGYRAIVLPNARPLSDEAAAAIDAAAESGASVIATFESGLEDEHRERRDRCALASLGLEDIRARRDDMRSAMIELTDKREFPSMADRDLVVTGDHFLFAGYADGTRGVGRLIPPHRFGPPEMCYWETVTELPGVTIHAHGSGYGVHLPWLPGRFYYREGYDNALVFVGDLLKRVCKLPAVEGEMPPSVTVTRAARAAAGEAARDVFHFVNNSGHFGTSYFAPPRLGPLRVTLPLGGNDAREPRAVKRVRDGAELEFSHDERAGTIGIELPELEFYEAVTVDY